YAQQPSRAGYGGAPGARPWPIQDRSQSRRLHVLCRARVGVGHTCQRLRNLPQSRSPAQSRHLHDVPHLRGSSVRGRKWPRGPHHDECGTRGFGRKPDRRANRLSQQLSDGVEGPLAEWLTGAVVRMLDFAQRYTSAVDFADLNRARFILERTNAFADPNEADARGISLILPTPDMLADAARL